MAKINGKNIGDIPGTIKTWSSASTPNGYLVCDGTPISRITYSALFAKIGTTYGSGDGSTTFNLPNLQGVFPRGAGTQNRYTFTVTSANATAGAVYSNNSQTFTVLNTISSSTTLITNGSGNPLVSGTLTKVSGTGDATITFSANTSVVHSATLGNHQNNTTAKNGLTIADPGHSHTLRSGQAFRGSGGEGTPRFDAGWEVPYPDNAIVARVTGITLNAGDTETRPSNVAVNYIIKY